MTTLSVIYQDDDCVAIDKPAGLLVHRTSLDTQATQFAMQMLRDQLQRLVYPVHRLDRATSGVLLFGFSSDIARSLTEQFAQRTTSKTYVAVVRGWCEDAGRIDLPLKDPIDERNDARKHAVEREASTRFTTLERFEIPLSDGRHPTSRYSLLELKPKTGRRHQIRRHLKHVSHPIVGDTTHGDHRHNKRLREKLSLHRMLLAATELCLTHPNTHEPLHLRAPRGAEFDMLLDQLRSLDSSD